MRVADHLVRTLAEIGVSKIFSLSGNQIMPIYDACIDAQIEIVHTRHEAAAVFMADAWFQLTGTLGVALVTAAPGFANALAPLYSARCAESAVLLLSGDSPVKLDDRGAFQELDQKTISGPLTKLSIRSANATSVGSDLARAVRVARSGRPGPVHLALPFDVVDESLGEGGFCPARDQFEPVIDTPNPELIARIGATMARAKRPVVITGPTLSATRAGDLPARLGEQLAVPVLCMESPRGLADPSLGDLGRLIREADLVFCLGKPIDHTLYFAKTPTFDADCRFLVVDPETALLERAKRALGSRALLLEQADVGVLAATLCEPGPEIGVRAQERRAWRARFARAIAARAVDATDHARESGIHPAVLGRAVQRVLAAAHDPILICDGGEFGQWAQACVSAPTRIINGTSGAIGGALCYGIAAKMCRPDATVIAMMGDGTIGFHLAEFETALRCRSPFITVVGHDARWNAEVQIQLRDYGVDRRFATDLLETRYDLAVEGLGGYGEWVGDAGDLEGAFKRALDSGLPACICVPIQPLPAPGGTGH